MYHVCAWCLQRPEEGIKSPGARIPGGSELTCGCYESNLSPLEEQQVLLADELSLQLHPTLISKAGSLTS